MKLRLDPEKIRVAIRPIDGGWRATISDRVDPAGFNCRSESTNPIDAVERAIEAFCHVPGV